VLYNGEVNCLCHIGDFVDSGERTIFCAGFEFIPR